MLKEMENPLAAILMALYLYSSVYFYTFCVPIEQTPIFKHGVK